MAQLSVWMGAGAVAAGVSAALLTGAGVAQADNPDGGPTQDSESSADGKPDKPRDEPRERKRDKRSETSASESESKPESDAEPKAEPKADGDAAPESSSASTERADTPRTTRSRHAPTAPGITKRKAAERPSEPAADVVQELAPVRSAPAEPDSLVGVATGVITGVVTKVGSAAFTAVQAVEAAVTGPPRVPKDSTVTVRSSELELGTGQRVDADWYYPETADGAPPERMILLQHGFFALGPMYSYTAATLAERTGAVVVAPTLPSNPFLGDDRWLGGTGMGEQIGDLFDDDRAALTASALDAGFGDQYDFGTQPVALPRRFALIGHSLGANLVAVAAARIVQNGSADDLVGVITLDGVPFGDTMATSIDALDDYEEATGRFIPLREIGAPPNLFNSFSNVNEVLSTKRAGHFNGVVLVDGVHMDSMRGGNPLIQFAAYLIAGFPQPQNSAAVDELTTAWLDEWFEGDPEPVYAPGSTMPIPTPAGEAQGVVIGNLLVDAAFAATSPTIVPAVRPMLVA